MVIENSRISSHRVTSIERTKISTVRSIVAHQTGSSTEQSTFNSYKSPGANGAHFLISKTGIIYQTASIFYRTNHIGPIRARCLAEFKCTPAENVAYKKMGPTAMHAAEMKKPIPERYASNSESIGVEIVGKSYLPANKTMPKGLTDIQQRRFFDEHSVYEALTGAQQLSFKYLIGELLATLSLERSDVFRHPMVSRKKYHRGGDCRMVDSKLWLMISALIIATGASGAQKNTFLFSDAKQIRYIVKSDVPHASSREPDLCRNTILDESRMVFFMKNATASTGTNYSRGLIQGDCSADGFVIVNERRAYRLTIDSATGWGAIESGPNTTYLYCEKCEGLLEKDFDLKQ